MPAGAHSAARMVADTGAEPSWAERRADAKVAGLRMGLPDIAARADWR